jgi:hypothetical protein
MNSPLGISDHKGQKSSGQAILLPNSVKERRRRSLLVEINSRDRNIKSSPSSNSFRWRFQRPMKDVTSIQIVGGTVPSRLFTVNTGWNSFTFLEGSLKVTVTLTPGLYTMSSIATQLQTQLNAINGKNNTYLVAVDPATDKITVSLTAGSTAFSFLFASGNFVDLYDLNNVLIMINSPARILGFLANDYSSSALSITAPNGVDVSLLTNRIYLYVNNDNSQDLGTIERSIGKQSPHAVLYMNTPTLDYKTFTTEVFEPLFRSSPAPIARLQTLDIALRDEFDRLVDLNGRDFTLLLEIEYLE